MATVELERAPAFAGFTAPTYTQVPNELFDVLLASIDNLSELKVLLFALRKTLGWHKQADAISVSQFVAGTGLSRGAALAGIDACLARGTLLLLSGGDKRLRTFGLRLAGATTGLFNRPDELMSGATNEPDLAQSGLTNRPELVYPVDQQKKERKRKKETLTRATFTPLKVVTPHTAYYGRLIALYGAPLNDSEDGRYLKAAKDFRQAGVSLDELSALKDAYELRWPDYPSRPWTVASNIRTLREGAGPGQGGRAVDRSQARDLGGYERDAERVVVRSG